MYDYIYVKAKQVTIDEDTTHLSYPPVQEYNRFG